jgi:hypothetical protein
MYGLFCYCKIQPVVLVGYFLSQFRIRLDIETEFVIPISFTSRIAANCLLCQVDFRTITSLSNFYQANCLTCPDSGSSYRAAAVLGDADEFNFKVFVINSHGLAGAQSDTLPKICG